VPPYTLAGGLASAQDTYLTPQEILPAGQALDPSGLPKAHVRGEPGNPPIIKLASTGDDRLAPGTIVLWLALVLAVVVLGLAVFRLSRPATAGGVD